MRTCIYCKKNENQAPFERKGEHLLPEAFGLFGQKTPILKCVCKDCNQYFGQTLDQYFARDSLEGMQRSRFGLLSSESRTQNNLKTEIDDDTLDPVYKGMPMHIDQKQNKILQLKAVVLTKAKTGESITIKMQEVGSFDISRWLEPGIEIRSYGTPAEINEMTAKLEARGMKINKSEFSQIPALTEKQRKRVRVKIVGLIDKKIRRFIAKTQMNFAAHFIGENEVLKPEWNEAREFIRHDVGNLPYKPSQSLFWSNETLNSRMNNKGYNIKIENSNGNLCGYLEFFNSIVHQTVLVRNYEIPDSQLIAGRFEPQMHPQIVKPFRRSGKILIAQFDPVIGWTIS